MSGLKVLIIEDSVVLEGKPLELVLRNAGYEVVGIAETAEEAVKRAEDKRPAIVLVDIGLSDGDLAGARAARIIQDTTGAQIIFITGRPVDRELLDEVRKTRDFQFHTKPWNDVGLLSSIRLAGLKAQGKKVVFLCYCHADRRFATELLKHVAPLEEVGVDTWVDTRIGLGQRWKPEISKALHSAVAAICLITIDFVNSAFIRNVELPKVLESAAGQGTLIVPVFVGPVEKSILERTGLLAFQGVGGPEDPIAGWVPVRRGRECWVPLCERLRALGL